MRQKSVAGFGGFVRIVVPPTYETNKTAMVHVEVDTPTGSQGVLLTPRRAERLADAITAAAKKATDARTGDRDV